MPLKNLLRKLCKNRYTLCFCFPAHRGFRNFL